MEKLDVLVIDDEAGVCLVISEALKRYGLHVQSTSSIEEALRIVRDSHPQIFLIDQHIQGGCGLDVAQRARCIFPEIKPVIMSALLEDSVTRSRKSAGVVSFVRKPFDLFELIELLTGLLEDDKADES